MIPHNSLAFITQEEIRAYLNAHFICCRILSKVIVPSTANAPDRTKYMIASMQRYEWLVKFAPKIADAKGVELSDVFGEEYNICVEMAQLLPSKIHRMHYKGEAGFEL